MQLNSSKLVKSPNHGVELAYFCFRVRIMKCRVRIVIVSVVVGFILGKDEKLRLTNLEWGVDFLRLTNLVKTS